jgi:hypothetical protein
MVSRSQREALPSSRTCSSCCPSGEVVCRSVPISLFIVLAASDRRIGGSGEETSLDEWELLSEWLHSSANIEAIGRGRHVSRP